MPRKRANRWRWHLRAVLASAIAGACRLEQHARKAREQRRPLILGYHRVVSDFATASQTEMPSLLISQAMFERHIESIGQSFRFVSLDEIGEHVSRGEPFAEPVAAIRSTTAIETCMRTHSRSFAAKASRRPCSLSQI